MCPKQPQVVGNFCAAMRWIDSKYLEARIEPYLEIFRSTVQTCCFHTFYLGKDRLQSPEVCPIQREELWCLFRRCNKTRLFSGSSRCSICVCATSRSRCLKDKGNCYAWIYSSGTFGNCGLKVPFSLWNLYSVFVKVRIPIAFTLIARENECQTKRKPCDSSCELTKYFNISHSWLVWTKLVNTILGIRRLCISKMQPDSFAQLINFTWFFTFVTLHRSRNPNTLGWNLQVTKDRTWRFIHGLKRKTQFWVSFLAP